MSRKIVTPTKSKNTNSKKKKKILKKKKIKIKYNNLLIILFSFIVIGVSIYLLACIPIKTIIIKGNDFLTDQYIIDLAGIRNYPSTFRNSGLKIEKTLKKDVYIKNVNVNKKRFLTKIIITIDENKPIFYYQPISKIVLEDGSLVADNITVPIVINQIPDSIYDKFLNKMSKVPKDVLNKMSEIKYTPNDVDAELFLITMTDGNYVYVNISKFERIYKYIEYVEGFDQKKGILHLDSGDYLEIKEGK